MPIMNGFEASSSLKSMMKEKKIEYFPIIAISAGNSASEQQMCQESGMVDSLGKPITIQKLRDKLEQYHII